MLIVGTKILVTLGKTKIQTQLLVNVWFLYEHIYTDTANRKIKVIVR